METKLGKFGFIIPIQTLKVSADHKLTPVDVAEWRKNLVLSNVGDSAKKIYLLLSDCNKVEFEPEARFQILELLRPPLQYVCQSLRKHYLNQKKSLTQHQLTIVNLAKTLQTEMAFGYKILIEQTAEDNTKKSFQSIFPISLQRLIHYHAHVLRIGYLLYEPSPKGIWRELHLVYKLAEQHNLLNQHNILDTYKKVLLMAAIYPYQWRQNDQIALSQALDAWQKFVVIKSEISKASHGGFFVISESSCFVVDLNEDYPPVFTARDPIQFTESCRLLDLTVLVNHLKIIVQLFEGNEIDFKLHHKDEPEYCISAATLQALIKNWGMIVQRINARKINSQRVILIKGLSELHYFLNDREVGRSLHFKTHPCILVDESVQGYGLMWEGDLYPALQPGEIIAIQRDDIADSTDWQIGKLKWMKHANLNSLKIGMIQMGRHVKAVFAELIKDGMDAGYQLPALLLEDSILTPLVPFKRGSIVRLIENDTATVIELQQMIEEGGTYKIFSFKKTVEELLPPSKNQEVRKKKIDTHKEKDDDGFDSVWSDL